jgi:hypothetical protein
VLEVVFHQLLKEQTMRRSALLSLLLPVGLACSGPDPSPTEFRPAFAAGCTTNPTITPNPASLTVPAGGTGVARFKVYNSCATTSTGPWHFTSSPFGKVVSVGAPNPSEFTLGGGGAQLVAVNFTAGSPGIGKVFLNGRLEESPAAISSTVGVTVTETAGIPFGPFDLFNSSGGLRTLSPFNLTLDFTSPSTIVSQIGTARTNHVKFVLIMTGGSHDKYLTAGKFDFAKWKAVQNTFNTSAIKTAIGDGVADGTIPFASLMDEPDHFTWGGVMNHALLDSMSRHTKSIFPTLRTGVVVQWDWQKTQVYQSVDVLVSQYGFHQDQIVERYRDSAVVSAKRQKVGLMFSMNLLGGGGTTFGTPMTATQVQNFGNVLAAEPYACGLTMWTWNDSFMANSNNKAAFNSVASTAGGRTGKACIRP